MRNEKRTGTVSAAKKKSSRQSFLHGALILTMAIVLVKVIGALFKIPLNWIITEDGMGYFNTAYAFYSPLHYAGNQLLVGRRRYAKVKGTFVIKQKQRIYTNR